MHNTLYWEIQKFLTLALKANPNVLECLYTPLIEHATELAREMLAMREAFLSKLVYQTYNGYVMSQFKKLQADLRNRGEVKWKHGMHLVRLLLAGITALREGVVPVHVGEHREQLLAIKRREMPWDQVEAWRVELHREFDEAAQTTKLPDRPDYQRANDLLLRANDGRADAMSNQKWESNPMLGQVIGAQPYPLLFVTISGAHLYGFPSSDSDYDLRGVHLLPLRYDFHQGECQRLRAMLEEEHRRTTLPESASTAAEMNELLIRLRLDGPTR